MPYSDDDLNKLGVSISGNALNTPHKTPSRSMMTEKTVFDSPVGIVVNSPNGKDRLIQEYERRLKVERSLVQSLQVDYDESTEKMTKLKLENDMLKDKLERYEIYIYLHLFKMSIIGPTRNRHRHAMRIVQTKLKRYRCESN
jgi:hypothetical protein